MNPEFKDWLTNQTYTNRYLRDNNAFKSLTLQDIKTWDDVVRINNLVNRRGSMEWIIITLKYEFKI